MLDREREIVAYLRGRPEGAPLKEIYDALAPRLQDEVSLAAYWKIVQRMEAEGKLEAIEAPGQDKRYRVAPTLSAENPISLDDLYGLLPWLKTTYAIAAYVDAEDYYEEHRKTVLRRAAEALLQEDAVELFADYLVYLLELLKRDVELLRIPGLADTYVRSRAQATWEEVTRVAYRALSLPRSAVYVPPFHRLEEVDEKTQDLGEVWYDRDRLREALQRRVFGGTFLRLVDVSATRGSPARHRLTVAGSDGATHASSLALQTASAFFEDYGQVITFNNSVAYSPRSRQDARRAPDGRPLVYSAPLTRETLDDPSCRGMVLAPFLFPDLSEAEYEHMARCATDVVQFRVDEAVITGQARSPVTGELWPKVHVHIRDGTITPQEREFGHYVRLDAYGEMVREGLRLLRGILERIMSAPRPPIFAGAVKSTQLRVFSSIVNWYIAHGSAKRFGRPIEPAWNLSRARMITDNAAMTNLLAALPHPGPGRYYVSCAVLRQFPSLTEFYYAPDPEGGWKAFLERRKQRDLEAYEQGVKPLEYHLITDMEDDDFLFLCENADFVSFYIGHTAGDPPPIVPRYEFLLPRRSTSGDLEDARAAVLDVQRRLVEALDETRFTPDRDHNFLSNKVLVRMVPSVVYQAHDYVKHVGKKLEAELRSAVIKRLIELKRIRIGRVRSVGVTLRPVPLRAFLERYARALQASGKDVIAPDDIAQEPRAGQD